MKKKKLEIKSSIKMHLFYVEINSDFVAVLYHRVFRISAHFNWFISNVCDIWQTKLNGTDVTVTNMYIEHVCIQINKLCVVHVHE